MAKKTKTNACRLLDQAKIDYKIHEYYGSGAVSGPEVANFLEEKPELVFKTLVCEGKSGDHYVFVLPVPNELDLKKAAKITGEKSVHMLEQKKLLPLTGYEHGGCSPIAMRKELPTFLDLAGQGKDKIYISGGRVGLQLELDPEDLKKIVPFEYEDLCQE